MCLRKKIDPAPCAPASNDYGTARRNRDGAPHLPAFSQCGKRCEATRNRSVPAGLAPSAQFTQDFVLGYQRAVATRLLDHYIVVNPELKLLYLSALFTSLKGRCFHRMRGRCFHRMSGRCFHQSLGLTAES